MTKHRNNQNYKRICIAIGLNRRDVYQLLDGQVSKSQIDGWGRGVAARKSATGNSNAVSVSRYREMTDEQFDAFCAALPGFMDKEIKAIIDAKEDE